MSRHMTDEPGTLDLPDQPEPRKRFSWEPDFVDPPERTGRSRWVGIGIGFVVPTLLAGTAFVIIDPWGMDSMTCKRLGKEAVKVSAFQDDGRQLLDVNNTHLVSDTRKTYRPPTGKERETVMTCSARGSWSNDTTTDLTVTLEVDSEENLLVFYVPTPGGDVSRGV